MKFFHLLLVLLAAPMLSAAAPNLYTGGDVSVTEAPKSIPFRIVLPKEGGKNLLVSARIRTAGVTPGEAGWEDARLTYHFVGADGKKIGGWNNLDAGSGTAPFRNFVRLDKIPDGAVAVNGELANFGKSGEVEFRNIVVQATNEDRLPPEPIPVPGGATLADLFRLDDAWRVTTPTREKISLNGWWQFHAGQPGETTVPGQDWGFFAVPGSWTESLGAQPLHLSAEQRKRLKDHAWYRRELTIPADWKGRRILLQTDLVQTEAAIYLDGKEIGRQIYPGGEFDLTAFVTPGKKYELALRVSAISGKSSGMFMAPGRIIPENSVLDNKGLLGDIFLESRPRQAALSDVRIVTSVRNGRIDFDTGFATLPPGTYRLNAVIRDRNGAVASFDSDLFHSDDAAGQRHTFGGVWKNPKLWDTDTPENLYFADLTLRDAAGNALDNFPPEEFGFREFTIDGRNFLLNGKKIHLRAFSSGYAGRLFVADDERMEMMCRTAREAGYNFLVCYNYNYNPGRFSYYASLHRVSSRLGMLSSVTLPHFNAFGSKLHQPQTAAEYRKLCDHIIRRFQNLPGVVMYAMNHNAMGYIGDQNPLLIGQSGVPAPEEIQKRPVTYSRNQGKITEAIARGIDPSRPIYHHQSGKLGQLYTLNCYLNWAPRQERSDWLETWEKKGDMPVFLVEWGLPHVASYSSYRGPEFIWSCRAVQCAWIDEYDAAILGETAFRPDAAKRDYADFQQKELKNNRSVNFNELGGNTIVSFLEDVNRVRAYMIEDNIRNMRARGLSGIQPWDQGSFWKCSAPGRNRFRTLTPKMLKKPGIVAEQLLARGGVLIDPCGQYELNRTGQALAAAFKEELGWIGGPEEDYTERSHNFCPGETVRKSLILLNDTRHSREYRWSWRVKELHLERSGVISVEPGGRAFVPIEFTIPADCRNRKLSLEATFPFGNDLFGFDILPQPAITLKHAVGVIDPDHSASPLLRRLGVRFREVASPADLNGIGILVIGRKGLDHLPFDLSKQEAKLPPMLILEQSASTLETLGIRNVEYCLRKLFPLSNAPEIRDWRGAGTLIPESDKELDANEEPHFIWQGLPGIRVWRAGNRGSVASVLPEKPAIGDWLPLVQGGFALQYAPLLLLRENGRPILFCQADVSGRTAEEPEVKNLLSEALLRLDRDSAPASRQVCYIGGKEGEESLRKRKIAFRAWTPDIDPASSLLVIAPGAPLPRIPAEQIRAGLEILALGLSGAELNRLLPGELPVQSGKYLYEFPENLHADPIFNGLSAADLAWRDRREFDAFSPASPAGISLCRRTSGAGGVTALQLPPWRFSDGEFYNRAVRRQADFTLSRLLHNLGAKSATGFIAKLRRNIEGSRPNLPFGPWWFRTDPDNSGLTRKFHLATGPGNTSGWRKISPERHFQHQFPDLSTYNGYFWYRLEFDLTREEAEQLTGTLHIGPVDDESWIYLNGRLLGEVTEKTNPNDYWRAPRSYRVCPADFKVGRNVLVIHGNDLRQTGGLSTVPYFAPDAQSEFYLDQPIIDDNPYRYYRW